MESKEEITDIEAPYISEPLSDAEKYKKLVQFKTSLFRDTLLYSTPSPEDNYFDQSHLSLRRGMLVTFIGGFFALSIGPFFLANPTRNASDFKISNTDVLILGGVLTGVGILLCTICCLLACSSKFRSVLLGCFDKPIYLPDNFNIKELNHVLISSGVNEIQLNSTKDLKKAYNMIAAACEATNFSHQFEIRKKTLLALQTTGIFAEGQKLILEYLIPSEEVLNKAIDKPR